MAVTIAARRRFSVPLILASLVILAALVALIVTLSVPHPAVPVARPTAEAISYLSQLELSDVRMQASENLMNQQVVEILGKITNKGSRAVSRIEVTCIFRDAAGHEIFQQRVPIVSGGTFLPSQTRSFRLPFDTLPGDWNQAMPNLVIAQIKFEA